MDKLYMSFRENMTDYIEGWQTPRFRRLGFILAILLTPILGSSIWLSVLLVVW